MDASLRMRHVGIGGSLTRPVLLPPLPAQTPLPAIDQRAAPHPQSPRKPPPTASIERTIRFIQDQHRDMTQRLSQEIDALKAENKDLKFRLIMRATQSDIPAVPRIADLEAQSTHAHSNASLYPFNT